MNYWPGRITWELNRLRYHLTFNRQHRGGIMGKHSKDAPSAGKTPEGGRGAKPQRHQMTQKTSGGATMWKATARLFGIGKGKK